VPSDRWVTLTTDFGSVYAAQVKAVLASLAPRARLLELSDDLPAHGVPEAAFLLAHMASGFPPGTIHLAVIDPGVGGPRAPLVIRCPGGTHLVGPDNGLLAPLADRLGGGDGFRIDRARVPGPTRPSATFDGRDLFAPAAALLALGRDVRRFATPAGYERYQIPSAQRRGARISGKVLHVDRFGNVITNIPSEWVPAGPTRRVQVGTGRVRELPVVRSYHELPPRGIGVVGSSFGTVEISGRSAPAAGRLGARVGEGVRIDPGGPPSKYSRR